MRRLLALLCLPLCPLALAACGPASATSTSAFSGVKHEVAQRIADFQSHASGAEEKKICSEDLAASIVARLGGTHGCEEAIKRQLGQVDNLEVSIESIEVAKTGTAASARVKSIYEGKARPSTLSLVKEAGKWKLAGE